VVRQGGAALADIEAVRSLGGSVDSDFTGTSGWRIGRIHRAEHPALHRCPPQRPRLTALAWWPMSSTATSPTRGALLRRPDHGRRPPPRVGYL